ncbi:TPA: hypothetical protein I7730_00890 [Vibrio vulnificus]|uniref:Uncharacterized protein n=1 Tax=Vibrio vulnificus TaxID=672 RepID=A0A8H9K5A1_VIBVL|nr:hypothetical protein [Vibrio vulnificus]HAS8538355.1 hypothetical protein [Vibrio vulnificus]
MTTLTSPKSIEIPKILNNPDSYRVVPESFIRPCGWLLHKLTTTVTHEPSQSETLGVMVEGNRFYSGIHEYLNSYLFRGKAIQDEMNDSRYIWSKIVEKFRLEPSGEVISFYEKANLEDLLSLDWDDVKFGIEDIFEKEGIEAKIVGCITTKSFVGYFDGEEQPEVNAKGKDQFEEYILTPVGCVSCNCGTSLTDVLISDLNK